MATLFFSEDFSENLSSSKGVRARGRQWELIRALLWQEKLHWMDGFLIFESWRRKRQKQDFVVMFRSVAAKVSDAFEKLGVKGTRAVSIRGHRDFWRLSCGSGEELRTNIGDAIRSLDRSRRLFLEQSDSAWNLVMEASKNCPDARSLCRIIPFAQAIPNEMQANVGALCKIQELMTRHRDVVAEAISVVAARALRKEQGITFGGASETLGRWVVEILSINDVLRLFEGRLPRRTSVGYEGTTQFRQLLKKLASTFDGGPSGSSTPETDVERTAIQDEQTLLLQDLSETHVVEEAKKGLMDYYEELGDLTVTSEIGDQVESAIYSFARDYQEMISSEGLEHYFPGYLRRFVCDAGVGLKVRDEICNSHMLKAAEKEEQLLSVLDCIACVEEVDTSSAQQIAEAIRETIALPKGAGEVLRNRPESSQLQSVKAVLRIGAEESPKWFRKAGPVAADFDHGRVYRWEPRLTQLKDQVSVNVVSMLEGTPGSGKTVLVRSLARDLYTQDKREVYFFDCDIVRDFKPADLIDEILSVTCVVIIENVHLNPRPFQLLLSKLGSSVDRHILLTARPSFHLSEYSRLDSLEGLKKMQLNPHDELWEFLEYFLSFLDWDSEFKERMAVELHNDPGNLWLLSYALKNLLERRGRGHDLKEANTVMELVETGIRQDLNDLRNDHPLFPQILVILASLYRQSVSMARKYLVRRVGIAPALLDDLVTRGEITCSTLSRGKMMHGLSSYQLADAYWLYGQEYWPSCGFPPIEDVAYDYAVSGAPNGLDAVGRIDSSFEGELWQRLRKDGCIGDLIRTEYCLSDVAQWIYFYSRSRELSSATLVQIAEKINNSSELVGIGNCISAAYTSDPRLGRKLWRLIDGRRLMDLIGGPARLDDILLFLMHLQDAPRDLMMHCCTLSDCRRLCRKLNQEEDLICICEVIWKFYEVSPSSGDRLWRCLDKDLLVSRLDSVASSEDFLHCLGVLYWGHYEVGKYVWLEIGKSKMMHEFEQCDSCALLSGLWDLTSVHLDVVLEILELLSWSDVAGRIELCIEDLSIRDKFVRLCVTAENVGKRLLSHMDNETRLVVGKLVQNEIQQSQNSEVPDDIPF